MMRHNDDALVQVSLPWLKFAFRTTMFVTVSLFAREMRLLDSHRGNCSAGFSANMDKFTKSVISTKSCKNGTGVGICFNKS